GRITARKGQLEVLKLFPKVLSKFPRATLVIVGAPAFNNEHEYLELLNQTITDLKISSRVAMMGPRSDVADIFQALDLLVVNSETEACSLVILEAMACGTPVLATSTGGTPELIEHKQTGWLVSWRNDDELENGIISLLGAPDLRSQLAVRARSKMSSFTLDRLLADVEGFYLNAFAQQSATPEPGKPAEIKTANFA